MNNNSRQSEIFDSLRAGLHAEDVDFKATCTPDLIDRENAYWQRVIDSLEEHANHDRATCNQLRIRRRQVLNGEHAPDKPRGLGPVAAGAAAGMVLFLGAVMWWNPMWSQPATAIRTASIEWDPSWSQPATGVRTASVEPGDPETTEFADNIDFYTWLEKQSDTVADSGGG